MTVNLICTILVLLEMGFWGFGVLGFWGRGERIVYDCLTENIDTITADEQGAAPEAVIEKRISDINHDQCMKWVANQLIKDGMLKPQEPVPQRVVWTADGPQIDSATMLSHAPDD